MTPEESLRQLGIELPPPPAPVAAYVAWCRTGNLILTSGQLPWEAGRILHAGRLGAEVSEEQGYEAARRCALNAMAQLREAAGSLDLIRQIVRLEGFVHCAPGFRGHPQVLNGASDLINQVFGDRGRHARVALGISDMPLNAPVQICLTAEVSS
jgi:enamine deaminase RidA (YjgF/YER057c/UK114 family)